MTNRPTMSVAAFTVPLLLLVFGSRQAGSQEPGSADEQLLESLIADPIDADVERELFDVDKPLLGRGPAEASGGDSASRGGTDEGLDRKLRGELGRAAVPEESNPLLEIARQMRGAEGLIGQIDSGAKTQAVQDDIVARLEELIEQARKCCQQCQGGQCKKGEPKPQQVASRERVKQPPKPPPNKGPDKGKLNPKTVPHIAFSPGSGNEPLYDTDDEEAIQAVLQELWGELPQNLREQMLELPVEELFLPKYELLIEQYFRRLAEEDTTPGGS